MAVTNYYTVSGEIIGEHTAGQSRLDYIPDALGSVTQTVNQSLTVESTARYMPYGANLATTGTQPMFGWVGSSGSYRRTELSHSDIYVQTRHGASAEGRWTSIDALWPHERTYCYVLGSPVSAIDPTGTQGPGSGTTTMPRPCPPQVPGPPSQNPAPTNPGPTPTGAPPVLPPPFLKGGLILGLTLLPTTLGSGTLPRYRYLRYPKPKLEPKKRKCDDLYAAYKSACDLPHKCTMADTDCNVISRRFNNGRNCVDMRIAFLLDCDVKGGGSRYAGNFEDHAVEMCQNLAALAACAAAADQNECFYVNLSNYISLCSALAKQFPGAPFPPYY